LGNILAESAGPFVSEVSYYFRIKTSSRDTDGITFPEVLIMSLDELSLNGVKQRRTNTAVAYTDINDMIEDYLFDYVNGHTANLHSSGVSEKAPMQF
jgi:hypothetical protein